MAAMKNFLDERPKDNPTEQKQLAPLLVGEHFLALLDVCEHRQLLPTASPRYQKRWHIDLDFTAVTCNDDYDDVLSFLLDYDDMSTIADAVRLKLRKQFISCLVDSTMRDETVLLEWGGL